MTRTISRRSLAALAGAATLGLATGCSESAADGAIPISGSSTVEPITRALAEQGGFDVDIAAEGTLDGFARFCAGETAINDASTPIPGPGAETDYVALAADNDVEFLELPIGLDALSLVRNLANDRVDDLTADQLRQIWEPGSTITTWSDVDPDWPDEPIGLYGREPGSGTLDVFTEAIMGETGAIRDDYRATDDLDELAGWIAEDEFGLGFMGVGNYLAADEEHRDALATVSVDGVEPSLEQVQSGEYALLTRPLLIYVSVEALTDEHVEQFVEYVLDEAEQILPRVYFYALPAEAYPLVRERFDERVTGSLFSDDESEDEALLALLPGGENFVVTSEDSDGE